jgi:flagellar M-ring protein FliF
MNQLLKLLSSLSVKQRISLAAAAIAIAAGLWSFTQWNLERNFHPAYTGLSPEDAGAVTAKLREQGIEYRLDESGGTVKVASDKVAEARLRLASAGLPKTGRIGFELFDNTNLGLTEFAEQVNYRRAVEGELERSITTLAEIERARVHITLPKDSIFLESRQEAKASVVVKMRPRARLSEEHGVAICHLVASAVDRLSPSSVTVIDTDGNLLVKPRRSNGGSEASDGSLEVRQRVEQDLVKKIHATLEPLLGANNFQAEASVDVEIATSEQSEETFDPQKVVVVSSQKSEDTSAQALPSGVPGSASNLPRPPARPANGGSGAQRKTENTSYQPSKLVRHIRTPNGGVKRMSLSVLVAHTLKWQGAGPKAKRTFEPPSPEQLKTIRELVAGATGLNTGRGDKLVVESQPFASALQAEPPGDPAAPAVPRPGSGIPLPAWLAKYLDKMSPPLLIGIGVGVFLTLLAPVVILILRGRKKATATAAASAVQAAQNAGSLPASEQFQKNMAERDAERERLEAETLQQLSLPTLETKKSEVLVKHLRKTAKADPAGIVQLLRSWIHEGGN